MLPSKPKSGILETSTNKTMKATKSGIPDTPTKATKSGVSDTSNNKTIPATPKVSKLGRAVSTKSDSTSPSPLQNSRLSIERSPKSVDSKPAPERRPLKTTTPPEKQPRALKGSEQAQEDLKKAREQLAVVEQEKARALEELNDAKRIADEASEKLKEALVAQKKAEESSEIEKFRADELEQAGIDAAHKKEEEWKKELENVKNQHGVDLAALLSTSQELQRVKHELAMTADAKNTALSHADDAMRIAEINAEKVMVLSGEVSRLKGFLDTKMENASNETADLVKKLNCEVDALKCELKNAKVAEEKLIKMEALVEELKTELTDAKRAEADALKLVDEWKMKAEEANVSENKTAEQVKKLDSEADALKEELERAKVAEEKLVETEVLVEQLSTEVTVAKRAEADAGKLVEEWKRKADLLEAHVEDANHSKNETIELVKKLDTELDAMKLELERAKAAEEKLIEMEAFIEGMRKEMSDAHELVDEWKKKAEVLEVHVEETEQSKKSALDTLASVSKQLEKSNEMMQDTDTEVIALKGIIESLEVEVTRHKAGMDESERHLDEAQKEAVELGNRVEALKSELQALQEEKLQALDNEKEERKKLINELEIAKDEGEKAKKAMEGLASALHEVSSETRQTQERLLAKQAESEDAYAQIEELRSTVENTEERYEVMLDEARYEIVCLRNSIERFETESKTLRSEWDEKELSFVGSIKKLEEEIASLKSEMEDLMVSLRRVEGEALSAREAEAEMVTKVREADEVAEAAKAETLKLKERLLDKENEVQSITQENDDLRVREEANTEKVRELSVLLAEARADRAEENGDHVNSDNEYDILPNTRDFQEITDGEDVKPKEKVNGNQTEEEGHAEPDADKDLESERKHEAESTDDELESKTDSSSFDKVNGLASERMENGVVNQKQQKKKKPLMERFGLMKKKSNHK